MLEIRIWDCRFFLCSQRIPVRINCVIEILLVLKRLRLALDFGFAPLFAGRSLSDQITRLRRIFNDLWMVQLAGALLVSHLIIWHISTTIRRSCVIIVILVAHLVPIPLLFQRFLSLLHIA